ncbi:MAG: tripartite tricarboxylate transporter substrate binding protein [Betaproteobacteria bacterium]
MRKSMILRIATFFLFTGFIFSAVAAYPDKPIRMIVGWSAGGGTDMVARVVAKHLSKQLNVAVVIENRDGASGMIATEMVANSPPDGYLIQYTVADTHSVNPHLFSNMRYDPINDFVPIAVLGYNPNVLIVRSDLGVSTLDELIVKARANPEKVTFGTWGIGSGGHVRMAALSAVAKINFLHVPFKGSGPAFQAVVAGQIDAMILPAALAKPQVATGKVKILSIDTQERYFIVPEVKTYKEQGLAIKMDFWHGLFAPKGTPKAIVDKVNAAFNAMFLDPEAAADISKLGIVRTIAGDGGTAAAKVYFDSEFVRWGEVIRNAKISMQ